MSEPSKHISLEKIFRTHYAQLVRASYRICQDQALSEDVVQNVFMKLHEVGLESIENPGAYLRRAVVTRTLNALRDRKKLSHPGDEVLTSAIEQTELEEEPDLADVKKRLHKAIAELPPRARLVLTLHRFEGLSYKEISDELDISIKTVENHMSRALKLLRTFIPKNR